MKLRHTGKEFELQGDLLKMITNKNYNVDLAILADKKLMFEFAKEMHFVIKTTGLKSTRNRSLIRLLKSLGIPDPVSGVSSSLSKTTFLSSDTFEICDRVKILLQEKKSENNSDILFEEIVDIVDKVLEYKYISKKQHKIFLPKYLN